MGEVRTRRLVASSLVMLLVLLVPVSAEEGDSVELEIDVVDANAKQWYGACLLYTSPSPRDKRQSRMPSSA